MINWDLEVQSEDKASSELQVPGPNSCHPPVLAHLVAGQVGHGAVYASWPAQGHCLDAAVGAGLEEARPGRGRAHSHWRRLRLGPRAAELQPEVPLEARVVNIACTHQFQLDRGMPSNLWGRNGVKLRV